MTAQPINDPVALEFITMVARLRYFQQLYFRSRSQVILDKVKDIEQKIDLWLEAFDIEMKITAPETNKVINLKIK